MIPESYDYDALAEHADLLALYTGWIGQKVCVLTTSAALWDRQDLWRQAPAEVDRLILVFRAAEKAKLIDLTSGIGALLGTLVRHCSDGGWWTSDEGTGERTADREEGRPDLEELIEDQAVREGTPLFPRLRLEENVLYPVADAVLRPLDEALRHMSSAVGSLDLFRLGTLLSGFCHRLSGPLPVRFVSSVLDDLASHELVDVRAENELRRELGLSEMGGDRRPLSISTPKSFDPPVPGDVQDVVGSGGRKPFDPEIDVGLEHRDLVLGCVFKHFGVPVPPAEIDASLYPELSTMKMDLQVILDQTVEGSPGRKGATQSVMDAAVDRGHFWIKEAIIYLGADQLGVDPKKFVYRLVRKGALPGKKINGRFVFYKADLDRVIANGDHKRSPGRPKKHHSA